MAEKKKMQKIVYLSNCRDFTNQCNINENNQFTHINELLEQGWNVAELTTNNFPLTHGWNFSDFSDETKGNLKPEHRETFAAYVLLEKDAE